MWKNCFRLAGPQLQKQFQLLVGEEPQKNWVTFGLVYFNYRIQGRGPTTGHGLQLGIIDPAFSREFSARPNFERPQNFENF